MIKWLAAFIGYEFARFPGAILGFIIGTIIDSYVGRSKVRFSSGGGFGQFSGGAQRQGSGEFELNLLSLSSLVIKADGDASQQELDYVRAYFAQTYGKSRANAAFRTFNEVIKKQHLDAGRIATAMRARTSYEMRLQILHFLFNVANADGSISDPEVRLIQNIANYLAVNAYDFESIKAMFASGAAASDSAYRILEIKKSATDNEIKKAYRTMVKKYHPDRLTGMDEAYIKGAREKFDKVQEAYDKIRKERGF